MWNINSYGFDENYTLLLFYRLNESFNLLSY